MFDIRIADDQVVYLSGRLDAAQTAKAMEALSTITATAYVDFNDLEYISSAGIGVLLATQRRLHDSGEQLKLRNINPHIRNVFKYAGFDKIFQID